MNTGKNFVTTTSKETAEELKKCGFKIVNEGNGKWTFLNDVTLNFENTNSKKVVFTDLLTL